MKDQSKYAFEIKEHIGTIYTSPGGWTTELNVVSWDGKPAKYDLRAWDPDHKRCDRGLRLHKEDLLLLMEILKEWFGDGK